MMTDTIDKREQAMKDTIYRDEAVEICERWRQRAKEHHDRDGWYMADILLRFIKEMPSASSPHKIIAQVTFDEEKLRESVKEAVERFKEEYEITNTPQGEWIAKDGVFYCSCCNNDSAGLSEDDVYVYGVPLPNYCKDCGARMFDKDINVPSKKGVTNDRS